MFSVLFFALKQVNKNVFEFFILKEIIFFLNNIVLLLELYRAFTRIIFCLNIYNHKKTQKSHLLKKMKVDYQVLLM